MSSVSNKDIHLLSVSLFITEASSKSYPVIVIEDPKIFNIANWKFPRIPAGYIYLDFQLVVYLVAWEVKGYNSAWRVRMIQLGSAHKKLTTRLEPKLLLRYTAGIPAEYQSGIPVGDCKRGLFAFLFSCRGS